MDVYLIRHTAPDIDEGICYGQSDLMVKDTFNDEVSDLRNRLPQLHSPQVYSSPLKRCLTLAERLFPNSTITQDARLQEINFGDWEMQPWDKIDRTQLDAWADNLLHYPVGNGETVQQLYTRSTEAWQAFAGWREEPLIIISHGGVIRSILLYLLQMPMENFQCLHIDYGGIVKVQVESYGHRCCYINR